MPSTRTVTIAALAIVGAYGLGLAPRAAVAQSGVIWEEGRPIFPSDRKANGSDTWLWGYAPRQFPELLSGGARPIIPSRAPKTIAFGNGEATGTIIIDTEARKLYYTLSQSEAYEYPISVGREGFAWTGAENHKQGRRLAGLASTRRDARAPA